MWKHKDVKEILLIGCPGFILATVACCLLLFAVVNGKSISLLVWLLAAVGTMLIVWAVISSMQQERRVKEYQAKREATALAIRDAVLAGKAPERPFFVYLRPFAIDEKFYSAPSGIPADFAYVEEYGWPTASHDMESVLANLVYSYGLLIALSDKPGDAGVAHIRSSDDTWKEEISAICDQAAGIFIVPFDYKGTAWEVGLLLDSGWLEKTFFVMPAEQFYSRWPIYNRRTVDYRSLWAAGQARYQVLSLPAYDPQGQILQVIEGKVTPYLFGGSPSHIDKTREAKRDIAALQARLEELVEKVETQ